MTATQPYAEHAERQEQQHSETSSRVFPLSDLLASVQRFFQKYYNGTYWITAEVLEVNVKQSGHYFFELGELEGKTVVAQVSARMWAGVAFNVAPRFEQATGGKIAKGMKLMLQVRVNFHNVYGLSLTILNINPEFTLGGLERIKRETIERLTKDGIIDLNKSQTLPLLPLRFAVISSETAAGWGDFCHQVEQNVVGKLFNIDLYTAIMQGERTTETVLKALDKILEQLDHYDAVIVIRGGGSKMDLSAFDEYHLCASLAQFPLPVLTGIGHERDESVADIVAHQRLKTPTAVAEFILQRATQALLRLINAENRATSLLEDAMEESVRRTEGALNRLKQSLFDIRFNEERRTNMLVERITRPLMRLEQRALNRILTGSSGLQTAVKKILNKQELVCDRMTQRTIARLIKIVPDALLDLKYKEQIVRSNSPENMMRRGFLPVVHNGQQLFDLKNLKEGDKIKVLFADGEVGAEITDVNAFDKDQD